MLNNFYQKFFGRFLIFTVLTMAAFSSALAQESISVSESSLVGADLPLDAARLTEGNVPSEVNEALGKMIAAGGNQIRQGDTEVLAWTKNYRKSNAPALIKQLTSNLKTEGWNYENGGENQGVTIFSVECDTPNKRVVVGFYTFSDDAFVWAWTEMLRADAPNQVKTVNQNVGKTFKNAPNLNGEQIIAELKRDQAAVNVMGTEMPAMPDFPRLAPKPGKARGYVKDWTGEPLQGAAIGVRASYFAGQYSGAQGKTDANGYYEFVVPRGSAHFYNAGYSMNWGDGIAAVGLHPADIPSRRRHCRLENQQSNARLPGTTARRRRKL